MHLNSTIYPKNEIAGRPKSDDFCLLETRKEVESSPDFIRSVKELAQELHLRHIRRWRCEVTVTNGVTVHCEGRIVFMDVECLQHLLTKEERAAFDRDGFMVVENALPDSMVKDLNKAMDRIDGAVDFVGKDDLFLELVDWPTVFPKVFGILGWNIHIYHTVALARPPDSEEKRRQKARLAWHQDSDRVNADIAPGPTMRISLKVGYLLTDLPKKGYGNQLFIPGSHLKRELEWPADGLSNPEGVYTLQAPAGSAVLFEQRVWHTGSPNLSDITRKTLYYGYSYRWFHPRDDRTVSHYMERSDPIRKQLLGAKTKALGLTSPQPEEVPLRAWMEEHLGEEAVTDKYTRLVGGTSVSFARNPDDHYAVRA